MEGGGDSGSSAGDKKIPIKLNFKLKSTVVRPVQQ